MQVLGQYGPFGRKNHSSLNHVSKLADIAGPMVILQFLNGSRVNVGDPATVLPV